MTTSLCTTAMAPLQPTVTSQPTSCRGPLNHPPNFTLILFFSVFHRAAKTILLKYKSDGANVMYQSPFPSRSPFQTVQNPSSLHGLPDTVGLVSAAPTSSPLTFLTSSWPLQSSFFSLSACGSLPSWGLCKFCSCCLESSFPESLHSGFKLNASDLLR